MGIKKLVPLDWAKLKILQLSIIFVNLYDNKIGSIGAKWLIKVSFPNL